MTYMLYSNPFLLSSSHPPHPHFFSLPCHSRQQAWRNLIRVSKEVFPKNFYRDPLPQTHLENLLEIVLVIFESAGWESPTWQVPLS